ncbi:MAG: helix-turn-helix domain-containing protein [Flexilinea sp.]
MANFIIRNENLMEERVFGDYSFPLEIFYNILSIFEHGFVDPHWHSELEFTIVQNGEMEYQINDKIFELKAGQGVFSNSKCLHTARPYPDRDCIFYSVVFNPILISSHENSTLNHYIDELVDSNELSSLLISPEVDWQKKLLEILSAISSIYLKKETGYDLIIKGKLCEFWSIFYNGTLPLIRNRKLFEAKNIQQMKRMLAFIQNNFAEKLTLENIAESANVSKSECCRLFKKVMKQAPVSYLIDYRIQKSIPLLLAKEFSITQIAELVGFGNSSYFSEMFHRVIHCSPSDYQKKH